MRVLARGDLWTIVGRTTFDDCEAVRLEGCGAANAGDARTLLTPFDRLQDVDSGPCIRAVRPRCWLNTVRRAAAAAYPFGALRTLARSRIDILTYQLEPAIAVAAGATRLLIADAVGLGKTIQAGLILNELAARTDGFRALVAAPAGLREQWARELSAHFSLGAVVADSAWLVRSQQELPAGVNPWVLPAIYIVSFDFLKRPEVLRALEDLTWDALVLDEAHNVTTGTARRAAVHAVALRSRRVVLLTATPHLGDPGQFDALRGIGAGESDSAVMVFRRSRADIGRGVARRSALMAVRTSRAERRMHRLLTDYTTRICREPASHRNSRARLAAIILRKRALSSAGSLARSASRRLALLDAAPQEDALQLLLPLADEDPLDDDDPDTALAVPGLSDARQERHLLVRIVEAATLAAENESKIQFLLRLLGRVREPAIVFTEYRDTLFELERALRAAGFTPSTLHGAQAPPDREAVQRAFNQAGMLLLATDAAAEGLNLQSRCRLVIHFELPWTPARLEQRTGRVDRIGQTRSVHEILLVARDTAERLVLAPLARRAARVQATGHQGSRMLDLLTEARVAAAILEGGRLPDEDAGTAAALEAMPPADLREAALRATEEHRPQRNTERHGSQRNTEEYRPQRNTERHGSQRNTDEHRGDQGRLIVAACGRHGGGSAGLAAVYLVTLETRGGRVEHTELVAISDEAAAAPAGRRWHQIRRAAADWLATREPRVRAAVIRELDARLEAVRARQRASFQALLQRELTVRASAPSTAKQLIQAGLFDGRSLRSGRARRSAAGAMIEESERHGRQLSADAELLTVCRPVALLWRGAGR